MEFQFTKTGVSGWETSSGSLRLRFHANEDATLKVDQFDADETHEEFFTLDVVNTDGAQVDKISVFLGREQLEEFLKMAEKALQS